MSKASPHAKVVRNSPGAPRDVTALEVLNNIDAMLLTVNQVHSGDTNRVDLLFKTHRRLLAGTRLEELGGTFRQEQNWIGGNDYNLCSAAFVPPPPEYVADPIGDLCEFSNDHSLPAVAQTAIALAQFETIHPFVDGNGRTERALIHMILRRRGLAERALPPVSHVLATLAINYIDGLTEYRHIAQPSSARALEGLNP
jgi:Fic family protein